MQNGDNWQCPFCRHFQVLGDSNRHASSGIIGTKLNKHGITVGKITAVECMNRECREIVVQADLGGPLQVGATVYPSSLGHSVLAFVLRPSSMARPQHATVPAPLVKDYEEACAIQTASPKASATLSRRCLQGMIRDFCGIRKRTLAAEIAELKKQVDEHKAPRQVSEESIAGIDAVRQIGNIGAHFEEDINLIVDVEPEEAQALIGLIELLFEEWYVAQFDRQLRLNRVTQIADKKVETRKYVTTGGKSDD